MAPPTRSDRQLRGGHRSGARLRELSAGLAAGVELAEAFTKITGSPILFAVRRTGLYGGVVWIAGSESLGALAAAEETLFADPSWAPLVDRHGSGVRAGRRDGLVPAPQLGREELGR